MKKASWFTFLLLLSISCLDSPDCFELNYNLIGISFKVMGTGRADTLRFYSVGISGTDSVFKPSNTATSVGFPLDFTQTNTDIIFEGIRGQDILYLSYDVDAQFVSEDCGSRFVIKNLNLYKNSTFDSVRLIDRTPGNRPSANIEVYRCPRTDTMAIAFRQLTVAANGARSSVPMSIPFQTISADFLGSPIYQNRRASILYLPVNLNNPQMALSFDLADGTTKKINLGYTLTTQVRYAPCGTQTYVSLMEILGVENTLKFDSVGFVRDPNNNRPIRAVLDPFDPMINVYKCPQTDVAGIYFRKNSPNVADTVLLSAVRVDGVAVPLQNNSVQFVNVKLNPTATSTKVEFDYQSGETKSITIGHLRTDKINFTACGTQGVFTELQINATDYDTLGATKNINVPIENLSSIPTKNIEIIQR